MTSSIWGETDFEDRFNVFASYTAFHVADIEANIYILMIFLKHCFNGGMERMHYL